MSTGISENLRDFSTEYPCDSLPGRLGDICRGYRDPALPNYSEETRRKYIEQWLKDGTLASDPDKHPAHIAFPQAPNAKSRVVVHKRKRFPESFYAGRKVLDQRDRVNRWLLAETAAARKASQAENLRVE